MSVDHLKALTDVPAAAQQNETLAPVIFGRFTFTSGGVNIEGSPSFDEWSEAMQACAVMERGLAFIVGDLIRFGEATYGERTAQIIDARNWKAETVRVYKWLSEKVPTENRMLDRGLSVAHHLQVAGMGPSEQRVWLRRALQDGGQVWSVAELRAAMKAEGETVESPFFGFYVICLNDAHMTKLAKMVELEGATVKNRKSKALPAKPEAPTEKKPRVRKRKPVPES